MCVAGIDHLQSTRLLQVQQAVDPLHALAHQVGSGLQTPPPALVLYD